MRQQDWSKTVIKHALASVDCKYPETETVVLQQRYAARHIAVGSVSCHTCTAVKAELAVTYRDSVERQPVK